MNKASVLIVEDHPIFSKGLALLINAQEGFTVVGEARNGSEALSMLVEKKPDLAVVDLNLGDEDGLEIIAAMKSRAANLKILVLSMYDERYYAERSLKAGASGYVMKEEASSLVVDALKTVLQGKIWLSVEEQNYLNERLEGQDLSSSDCFASINQLSNRQLQVFLLIGKGFGTIEIAAKLDLSTKTIDAHKEHIKQKLHCANSQELRQLAVQWNAR
ncbi:MAG: response regulator transcription factor [Treponema sp.]|mgnify:CR=1 FL=1|jgi:DNA-binding NarL/FixJ family response regulator|nr:response regulator transcription factor [Treponema sp.]